MGFKKAIVQIYSGNEPFSFNDFIKGTLRFFNYAIDHNIDVKVNIVGSEFEPYMIVNNYAYDSTNIRPRIYHHEVDQVLLVKELDNFMASSDVNFYVTSNVCLNRSDIYHMSFLGFDSIVRYKDYLYAAAQQKVLDNLLYRPNSDNLLYGYSIIYINREDYNFKNTSRNIASIANQIRKTMNLNKDTMVFSNSIQLRKIISQYIQMNSTAVQTIDDSDIDIGVVESFPSVEDIIIDFIILMKSKKIYRFTEHTIQTSHNIRYGINQGLQKNIYETALDINTSIGNLEIITIPLYYEVSTIIGCAKPTPPALLKGQPVLNIDASGNPVSQYYTSQPGVTLDTSGNFISQLNNPSGVALDLSGNLFIADTGNNRICMLDLSGNFTVYAGSVNGTAGYRDTNALNALFNSPTAIAIDKTGTIYIADTGNNRIRIIEKQYAYDTLGQISISNHLIVNTLVGGGSILQASGKGSSIKLNAPRGVAVDSQGLYISDTGNNRICKVTLGGTMITLAGSTMVGTSLEYLSGYLNGKGEYASFNYPTALTVDLNGNIFVADTGNNVIRRVTQSGFVSTVAGSGQPFFKEGKREQASFKAPVGIAVDLQNILYISDTGNNTIRRITTDGDVLSVVGAPDQKSGSIDGYGSMDPTRALVPFNKRATFNGPTALAVDPSKKLYIADTLNNTVRRIDPTFSLPVKIKPVAMQTLKISSSPGVGLTLGPTLSAQTPPESIIYGHRKGGR
jgi:sugar lactone lactonase YvrE